MNLFVRVLAMTIGCLFLPAAYAETWVYQSSICQDGRESYGLGTFNRTIEIYSAYNLLNFGFENHLFFFLTKQSSHSPETQEVISALWPSSLEARSLDVSNRILNPKGIRVEKDSDTESWKIFLPENVEVLKVDRPSLTFSRHTKGSGKFTVKHPFSNRSLNSKKQIRLFVEEYPVVTSISGNQLSVEMSNELPTCWWDGSNQKEQCPKAVYQLAQERRFAFKAQFRLEQPNLKLLGQFDSALFGCRRSTTTELQFRLEKTETENALSLINGI